MNELFLSGLFSKRAARIVVALYTAMGVVAAVLYLIYPIVAKDILPLASTTVSIYMLLWFGYDWGFEKLQAAEAREEQE